MNEVDIYINKYEPNIQNRLVLLRQIIKDMTPNATETISYGLIGYKLNNKPLVYFGGFKKHIGFYATPEANEFFQNELSNFKHSKGSIQFSLDKPLPIKLIKAITKFKIDSINRQF